MQTARRSFISGFRTTALWTLASRVLGMVRDVATAALLGMSAGGVMDAFVIAFRVPNLFRRLFGEGAVAASYLPVLTEQLESDRRRAWQLVSVGLTWLAVSLTVFVLIGEAICWGAGQFSADPHVDLLLGLTAVMIPYLLLICLAAQVAATLHALGQFGLPAFVPVLLNVSWIIGAWIVAPQWSDDKATQAYILACCILFGGGLQLGVQVPALYRHGFRYDYDLAGSRDALRRIIAAILPMMAGLAVTQINTLADSVIAWGFSAPPEEFGYPLQRGAVAAIYYGERLFQFPLGVVGIALATVIYPLLSRHAAGNRTEQLGNDLTIGLRLVLFLAVPASAGLILLAEPLARLLFERGEFTAVDTSRTARMIVCYGLGAWASCSLPVLVRGFYALGDLSTPIKTGAAIVGLNLALNLILIWPLAEAGLAVATSISAAAQAVILTVLFSRNHSRIAWSQLCGTLARSLIATGVMWTSGFGLMKLLPDGKSFHSQLIHTAIPVVVCVAVYFAVFLAIRGREPWMLLGRAANGKSDA
ncbi:MAG: murein biosynthesis integral membrane protein MurJ [Pirellulales bacterium]